MLHCKSTGNTLLVLQELFNNFRAKVVSDDNINRLFVMVVDEAHHAAVKRGAHDAFANDFRCETTEGALKHGVHKAGYKDVPGEWFQHENLITLLVSATPACVLTADSRLPRRYYVPDTLTARQKELAGTEHLHKFSIIKLAADPKRARPQNSMQDADNWICKGHLIKAADLRRLISEQVSSFVIALRFPACACICLYHQITCYIIYPRTYAVFQPTFSIKGPHGLICWLSGDCSYRQSSSRIECKQSCPVCDNFQRCLSAKSYLNLHCKCVLPDWSINLLVLAMSALHK